MVDENAPFFELLLLRTLRATRDGVAKMSRDEGSKVVGESQFKTAHPTQAIDSVASFFLRKKMEKARRKGAEVVERTEILFEDSRFPSLFSPEYVVVSDEYDGTKLFEQGRIEGQSVGMAVWKLASVEPVAIGALDLDTGDIYIAYGGKTERHLAQASFKRDDKGEIRRWYKDFNKTVPVTAKGNDKTPEEAWISSYGLNGAQRELTEEIRRAVGPKYSDVRGGIMDLLYVVNGTIDAFVGREHLFETAVYPVAEWAGLKVTDFRGAPLKIDPSDPGRMYEIVCAAEPLHGRIIEKTAGMKLE
jgi:hypothetical protein